MANNVMFAPRTARLVSEGASKWGDVYPAWQPYADECERLLTFVDGHGQLSRFWPRLVGRPQQRDEALNEMRVAYFFEQSGFPIIGWEVVDALPYNVEFEISTGGGKTAYVEVKSPGWESELSEAEIKAGRARQDKYDDKARAVGPEEVVRRTVKKAMPKFTGKVPSLIVISDDCFVNIGTWGTGPVTMALTEQSATYGPGVFRDPAYATVGGVCLFWMRRVAEGELVFASVCVTNPWALPTAVLPDELVAKIAQVNAELSPA